MGDLNKRRGRIIGIPDTIQGFQIVEASAAGVQICD